MLLLIPIDLTLTMLQQIWLLILCLLLLTFIVANLPGTFVIPVPVFKSRLVAGD